jgi:hypothetical protein
LLSVHHDYSFLISVQHSHSPVIASRPSLSRRGTKASAATLASHYKPGCSRVTAKPIIKTTERYPQMIASTASARKALDPRHAATFNFHPTKTGIPILAISPTPMPQTLSRVFVVWCTTNEP